MSSTNPGSVGPIGPVAPPPRSAPLDLAVELCASDQPLALLPVRLETRFFAQAGGASELRIRVYPDKIHLDSHETALLPAERQWAQHYWLLVWRSGGSLEADRDAWRQLADRYGAPRAAWLVRAQRPANLAQRPTSPVGPDEALPVSPDFPQVEVVDDGRDASWRRAPLARLMPDRWIAVATSGGQVVSAVAGGAIVRPLPVGPSPQAAIEALPDDEPAVDDGMRWMIDFEAAEAAGMGLRMSLPAPVVSAGIDRLVVLGVAASLSPADAAAQLDELLDAHRHTDGLEFLRLGTPTNNTAERRSGYESDPGHERSRKAIAIADTTAADGDSNASVLAHALGIAPERVTAGLAGTLGGAHAHARDQRSMNTALWSPTWGYYLANMIGFDGTGLSLAAIAWVRSRFITHVRAGGHYAALRCGHQPYGVLPVTSFDLWQHDGAPPPPPSIGTAPPALPPHTLLRNLLLTLRDRLWRARAAAVPRVGRTGDPDTDLAEVMRSDAASNRYAVRPLLGRHYVEHLRTFVGEDLAASGFSATQESLAVGQLQRLGLPWRPRVTRAVYGDLAWRMSGALVQASEVSPWHALEPDYIAALLAAPGIDDIRRVDATGGPAASLLHALLRHAMLLEYAGAAAALLGAARGVDPTLLLKDFELVDLVEGPGQTSTWRRQLDERIDGVTGGHTLAEHLATLGDFGAPATAALGAFRASLAHLRTLDSETLLHLMQGTLDLASHRLDAWIASFASERLTTMREAQALGLRVGGYGWVENLRPSVRPAQAVTPPPGEAAPLVAPADDTGFIHAPSMAHAATAALLRNAHLGHDGVAQPEGPFAIDLSSSRLRDARWLLDGVRQGQPLGALLGYRFERRLHELGLDRFVAPFRELAPLAARKLVASAEPLESIAANNVVDGLVLWQKWSDQGPALLAGRPLPQPSEPGFAALRTELDALGEAIDATSDALTAEAAYQMVRGNVSRTASTLAAVASGDAPVPELEVARTPRTGVALTHRVLLAFSGTPGATPGWAAASKSPRAAAEPMLNAWAARLLGDPRKVVCTIEQLDEAGTTVVATHGVKLSELQLTPMDLVYGVDPEMRSGQLGEVQLRLLHHLRSARGLDASVRLRIVGTRASSAPGAQARTLSLDDVLGQAVLARRLLPAARPLEANDLELPELSVDPGIDLAELQARCAKAEAALAAAHKALAALLRKTEAAVDAPAWRAAIARLLGFGVAGAVPVVAVGDGADTRTALRTQATALAKETQARLDQGTALRGAPQAATVDNRRDALLLRLRAVFGAGFVALPRFACGNAPPLTAALAASTAVQGGDPLAVHTWFDRVERVRDAVARFGAVLRAADVLAAGERLRLAVAQLPMAAGERWVGLPSAPGHDVAVGRVSLVIHTGGAAPPGQPMAALDASTPLCGLLVDEWVEVVPSRSETTALAFQFNPPDACAPQAVLLAVPPVPGQPWTVSTLYRTLIETMDLAQLRGVDAESLGELGHYLPALGFAINADDDAVSTDFGPMTSRFPS
jgi:hypothetical protein